MKRTLKIRALPGEGIQYDSINSTVVIIDVLRATTTIAVLLSKGAKEVLTTNDINSALKFSGIKIGERKSIKIDGFDYNNSPTVLLTKDFKNSNVILTTSNGTKAVETYKHFKNMVALSFSNFAEVKKYLKDKDEVILVCSGSHGEFSLEDFVCAKLMADSLEHEQISDLTILSKHLNITLDNYKDVCKESMHSKHLIKKGFGADVDFSLKIDTLNVLPVYNGNAFVREVL
jgi:2-phosphosulfolactate phosphatase